MHHSKILNFGMALMVILCCRQCDSQKNNSLNLPELLSSDQSILDNIKSSLVALGNHSVSSSCKNELMTLVLKAAKMDKNALFDLLRYIDSSAKPVSGILSGNIKWLGSYKQCIKQPSSHYCQTQVTVSAEELGIKKAFPITFGLCAPIECTENDISTIVWEVVEAVNSSKVISYSKKNTLAQLFGKPAICRKKLQYSNGNVAVITLVSFLVLLCVIGTILDYLKDKIEKAIQEILTSSNLESDLLVQNPNLSTKLDDPDFTKTSQSSPLQPHTDTVQIKENAVVEFFRCFSISRNTRAIFSCHVPKGAITTINGIRTLSMFWVILGHTYFYGLLIPPDNLIEAFSIVHRFSFMTIANAFFAVDTFFLLSGLLVAYLTLRRLDVYKKIPLFAFYLNRFLRLTPTYMFVILLYMFILPILGDGPSWYRMTQGKNSGIELCRRYWWTNLLYINNFHPNQLQDECIGWSWYLSNDMQFYVISPLIIYAMYRFKYVGVVLANGITLLISFVITGSLIGIKDLDSLLTADFSNSQDRARMYGNDVYIKPYCRIAPYLVGLILGYVLHYGTQGRRCSSKHWMFGFFGWIIAFALGIAVVFGPYHAFQEGGTPFTKVENVFYGTFSRFAWGAAVALVIYLCCNGIGGPIDSFLSWKAFMPLSRLTYCAYLIHPMVIDMYYDSLETSFHYSDISIVYHYFAFLSLAYSGAYVIALLVEFPTINLQKMIFKY